ncbi:MAG: helix-turn-helix transcriptional regulator [Clostridiales bacterium]
MLEANVVAKRLVKLRANSSRDCVARAVGISYSALSMYETGARVPRDDIKVALAKYYNTTVQEIFFDA